MKEKRARDPIQRREGPDQDRQNMMNDQQLLLAMSRLGPRADAVEVPDLRGASRSRLGPNGLKIGKETTHDLLS